jgi:glycosyltransferase involved in cell wall biosynthesis
VPGDRVTVVRNGPAAREIAAAAGPPADQPHRIVYLGVLGPQDNVEALVLAAEQLIERRGRAGWRVTIAGDGEMMPALAKLVADRGLADVVEFTGWLEGPAVDELLRSATVAIQPDAPTRMNHLSTMAKTVEYLGRGVPVIAADLVETRRTAADTAFYVPHGTPAEFAAAIDTLLDDPARRAQMGAGGLARFAERLSWERQVESYLQVWHRLLGTPSVAAAPPSLPRQRRLRRRRAAERGLR